MRVEVAAAAAAAFHSDVFYCCCDGAAGSAAVRQQRQASPCKLHGSHSLIAVANLSSQKCPTRRAVLVADVRYFLNNVTTTKVKGV